MGGWIDFYREISLRNLVTSLCFEKTSELVFFFGMIIMVFIVQLVAGFV